MLKLRLAVFALIAVVSARADWTVTNSQVEDRNAAGVEHRRTVLTESPSGDQATIELALFPAKSATLRVIDNPTGADSLAGAMERERCLAGVNGGYFDPKDAPIGLLVSQGRMIAPLTKARLLAGVVSVLDGRIQIQRLAEFSSKSKATEARQCGPFLVEKAKVIVGLNNTRRARRTFVATSGNELAAIGYCSRVTLAQLGDLLATPGLAPNLKIQRALNLDGGSSSGFWFTGENGAFSIREQKTVRDFLAIVAKP